ncbi:ABC transporter ATP-binding protein [Treponema sp.]|uniref:ABC transporter ATP-binding protein n=1 Tax=Treponema sp. TaxID=166 RepID=UPI0025D94656|nr:ATP-binding cassette domain-containing protein [Treponema sp.]MCR5218975.1 ABC transporter ATP-binding protein [Treponema sp.]
MIEVEHVSKKFGNFSAVDDISFSIQTGEIIGLLGPNGAGKTTTMRMITGYLEPTSGSIKVDGIDVTEDPVGTKRKIGYMPESAPLYGDMIVADYLKYLADIEGADAAVKIPELCKLCGLKEVMHKNINELSRGNKQRVGLAHALMNDPEILILDEPTSGLDPNQVVQVRELVKEIGKTRTVIISTHILSEVEALANRVIIISGGKKVADSSTEELEQHYGSQKSVTLLLCAEETAVKEKLSKVEGVSKVTIEKVEDKLSVTISISGDKEIRPAIAKTAVDSGWLLYSLEENRNSLEDVFRTLTNGGSQK